MSKFIRFKRVKSAKQIHSPNRILLDIPPDQKESPVKKKRCRTGKHRSRKIEISPVKKKNEVSEKKKQKVSTAEPKSRQNETLDKKDESYDGDQSNNNYLTLDYLEKRGKSENNDDDSVSEDFSEDEFEPAQPEIEKSGAKNSDQDKL